MTKWERHYAPRAVVPPPHLLNSRDVISANTMLALASPSAFGIGINRVSQTNPTDKTPLPLYYVSPHVAADRSPALNAHNAPGVEPGWYVVAEPGERFEIVLSPLHGTLSVSRTTLEGDVIRAALFVDGARTDPCGLLYRRESEGVQEMPYPGFVDSVRIDPVSFKLEKAYRQFVFEKARTTEATGANLSADTGSIRLALSTALRGFDQNLPSGLVTTTVANACHVTEKAALKKGLSVGVRRDGARSFGEEAAANYRIHNEKPFPSGSITIFIRERFWLLSRNIINRDLDPVKFVVLQPLLTAVVGKELCENNTTTIKSVKAVNDRKRVKRELRGRKRKCTKFAPGEVIDLS